MLLIPQVTVQDVIIKWGSEGMVGACVFPGM